MGKRTVVVNKNRPKEVIADVISEEIKEGAKEETPISAGAGLKIPEVVSQTNVIEYRVASKTSVQSLASAIAKCFLESRISKKKFIVRALGQEPINQALKGIIRAISMLAQNGHYIVIKPFWIDDIEKEKAGDMNVMGFHILEDLR